MAKARQTRKGKGQLSVWISEEALRRLAALQKHYAKRAGLLSPVTQAEAVEIVLRDSAAREGADRAAR